ncbi:sugar-transfer associated ATP-grasp domain-containing protein [Thermodesulfobacteriota bacterium]
MKKTKKMNDFLTRYKILPVSRTLEYKVKTWLTPLRKLIVHLKTEKRCPLPVPFSRRLKAWNLGFTSMSYILYDLEKNNPEDYLRDFSDINFIMNNPGAASINDKFNFSQSMRLLGLPSPEIFLLIDRGAVLYSSKGTPDGNLKDAMTTLLENKKRLVLKPAFRGAGFGVFFIETQEHIFLINGIHAEPSEILSFLKKQRYYLVTEFIQQAPYAGKINPHTTNTVRILTIRIETSKTPVIAASSHRIGSRASFPLDNFHGGLGGLSSRINPVSGELGPGIALSESGNLLLHKRHPETGSQIEGVKVPHWESTKKMVLTAASHFAHSPYVGWDLVITGKGCCFLEGNSPPGTAVWQVHEPLLLDQRLRSFYRDRGML